MKVTKHQRKRSNESNLRIENNEQLLSYPYLTVVRIFKNHGGGINPTISSPIPPLAT